MKKVIALALALVMAFSMSVVAFAETTTAAPTTKAPTTAKPVVTVVEDKQSVCGACGSTFDTDEALLAHEANCETLPLDITAAIEDVVNAIVEIVKANVGMSGDIADVVKKLIDFVAGLLDGVLASESGVNGIVADLEALIAGFDFEIPVLSDLINKLKGFIKDLYAGEVATLPAETPETGSSAPVGIAVFAAVSVAAAAAYVCTKKKD